jgi:hypothetical protein
MFSDCESSKSFENGPEREGSRCYVRGLIPDDGQSVRDAKSVAPCKNPSKYIDTSSLSINSVVGARPVKP